MCWVSCALVMEGYWCESVVCVSVSVVVYDDDDYEGRKKEELVNNNNVIIIINKIKK